MKYLKIFGCGVLNKAKIRQTKLALSLFVKVGIGAVAKFKREGGSSAGIFARSMQVAKCQWKIFMKFIATTKNYCRPIHLTDTNT